MPPIKRLGGLGIVKRISDRKTGPRDAIDRDALRNMRSLRATWSKPEDMILKMARTVYFYVAAPVVALGLLAVGQIARDIIRHNIGAMNKTSQACARRIQFLVKQNRDLPEVPNWLHSLQTNDQMQAMYGEDFLNKLKSAFPVRSAYCEALRKHFVLIMHSLYQMVHHTKQDYGRQFLIPNSMADYQRAFHERLAVPQEKFSHYYKNPANDFDLQIATVIGVLHSSMCSVRDKTLYSAQTFEIYKHYSEQVLHAAFTKARGDALVVAIKRRHIQLLPKQIAGPAYALSARYRQRLQYLKLPYTVFDSFSHCLRRAMGVFFPAAGRGSEKSSLELCAPHLGQLFFMGETLAKGCIRSDIKLPINILTIDTDSISTVSSFDRILEHYHTMFDHAPKMEYMKNFDSQQDANKVRVNFHPANLSYKVKYVPYDIVAKLFSRLLHFFCALDHLQKDVEINFGRLYHSEQDDEGRERMVAECPFRCILSSANIIDEVVRIVQEKRDILKDLKEPKTADKRFSPSSGVDFSLKVEPSNLLSLIKMLETFWQTKEAAIDRKDFGKLSPGIRSALATRSFDWPRFVQDIAEFDASEEDAYKVEEHEPTMNKEERVARAQDVFVVKLPTLQLSANASSSSVVPQSFVFEESRREVLFQKILAESYWRYTDNTFESLRASLDELQFSAMEQRHLEDVHNFIEARSLGVTAAELLREFPYETFLVRALRTLAAHFLIKRVGVGAFLYVHKTHMRPWVVHTFHVKRLQRENIGEVSLKRGLAHVDADDASEVADDEAPSSSKTQKMSDEAMPETPMGKRVSKPVERFENSPNAEAQLKEIKKDVIVMRPQPWMRLNGAINRRVLDRWLGSLLSECISNTGCYVQHLFHRFPHLYPVDLMFLLELLCDIECVHLTQIEAEPQVDAFSPYPGIKESVATELYDPGRTYVTPHADAVMQTSLFIGDKKYSTEFV